MAYHTIQPVPLKRWQEWALAAGIAALALAASWVGLRNGFTYDDVFIVQSNEKIRNLANWWRLFGQSYWPAHWGADGYRPFTMLAFMLEWAAAGGKPWFFHAVNLALYAGSAVLVFFLARTCLPVAAAVLAGALFAVHPLHVEAVASVVGQAELLVAVFALSAVTIYVNGRNSGPLSLWRQIAIAVLFMGACFSKEHGIVVPLLLLAAELIIVRDKAPIGERFVKLRPFVLALTALAFAYLWAHFSISNGVATGFHPYVPFRTNELGPPGRIWTMFGLVPDWIRLFLWPAHLQTEYGPPEYPVVHNFQPYQLPGILILLAALGLVVFGRRRSPPVSFGIAFAIIALLPTSNFIVATGILLAERTLFLPSAGVMIAVGASVPWLYKHLKVTPLRVAAAAGFALVAALGIWKSHNRTQVWKDNETLFSAAPVDAPNVYRPHYMLGAWRFGQKRKVQAEAHYRRSIELYDHDPYVFYSLGQQYLTVGMFNSAVTQFRSALILDSAMTEARARLAVALMYLGQYDEAERHALQAIRENSPSFRVLRWTLAKIKQGRKTGKPPLYQAGSEPEPDSGNVPRIVQKTPSDTARARGVPPPR